MPELRFENHVYQVDDFDTVLNTLLKNGHAIPNFCRGGICHSCMMKAEEGTPLPFTQIGLNDELVNQNYFLTCQCAVYAPMTIRRPDKDKRTRFVAMVRDKQKLSDDVTRILLSPEHEFVYQAGQFTTLINVDGVSGDFPIASTHGEGSLMAFHIADDKQKPLNQYIIHELEVNDGLEVMTALGDCYYGDSLKDKDLVVVGVDNAIASGLSLIKKALEENHRGTISVICGQFDIGNDYFNSVLAPLKAQAPGLDIQHLVGSEVETLVSGLADRIKTTAIKKSNPAVLVAAAPDLAGAIFDTNEQIDWYSLSVDGNV